MAKSIKLGNDTYLDSSGVTVTNTGKTLKNFVDGYGGTYTPTFTFTSGTGTVANVSMRYMLRGGYLYISGRFQVTAVPSTNSNLDFTLPSISGVTMNHFFNGHVGTVGFCDKLSENGKLLVDFRIVDNTKVRMLATEGNYLFPTFGTGYFTFGIISPVSIT